LLFPMGEIADANVPYHCLERNYFFAFF